MIIPLNFFLKGRASCDVPLLFGTGTQRGLLKITPAGSLGPKLFASLNPVASLEPAPSKSPDTIVSKLASD